MSRHPVRLRALLYSISLSSLMAGCESQSEPSSTAVEQAVPVNSVSFRNTAPRDYLRAVFSRYRAAGSYRDEGQVRLEYRENGQTKSRVAPLSVWFERETLYLRAYDTRLWSDSKGVTAWIVDPTTGNFDSQVMRSPPVGRRPELSELLVDPILTEQIAAGLAGPPPQLEWLFAAEPMKHLFRPEYTFQYTETQLVEGLLCQAIEVTADAETYRFWVDTQQGLLRQIDMPSIIAPNLPSSNLPSSNLTGFDLPDPSSQSMRLTLQLRSASLSVAGSLPSADSLPRNPKFVSRFIPLPPPPITSVLGTKLDEQKLFENDSSFRFDADDSGSSEQAAHRVTAMVYFAGDQSSFESTMTLQQWYQQMPADLRRDLQAVVLVTDQIATLSSETKQQIRQSITLPTVKLKQASSLQALGLNPGDLMLIAQHGADRRGTLMWIQSRLDVPSLPSLGLIIADMLSGVDIPERLQQQHADDLAAYRDALRREHEKLVRQQLVGKPPD